MNYLNQTGLSYFWTKVKAAIAAVQTSLTAHTDDEDIHVTADQKITWNQAQPNVIICVKKNGDAIAPINQIVDISVPTKLSELKQDVSYATPTEVSNAVSGAGHLSAAVLDELPAVSAADSNTIYFLRKQSGAVGDMYYEYKLINGAYELIGSAEADLSTYATTASVEKASSTEITSIFNTLVSSSEKYIGTANLAALWALIKPLIAANTQSITDLQARVDLLELILTSDVSANSYYITFSSLDGVNAEGVWNADNFRIDF